jgi:RNA processing factor Prp31
MDQLDKHVDQVNRRIDQVDKRINAVESRLTFHNSTWLTIIIAILTL